MPAPGAGTAADRCVSCVPRNLAPCTTSTRHASSTPHSAPCATHLTLAAAPHEGTGRTPPAVCCRPLLDFVVGAADCRSLQALLLPAAACCCLLLPAAACCCLLLPAAALYCLLRRPFACPLVAAQGPCGGGSGHCPHRAPVQAGDPGDAGAATAAPPRVRVGPSAGGGQGRAAAPGRSAVPHHHQPRGGGVCVESVPSTVTPLPLTHTHAHTHPPRARHAPFPRRHYRGPWGMSGTGLPTASCTLARLCAQGVLPGVCVGWGVVTVCSTAPRASL